MTLAKNTRITGRERVELGRHLRARYTDGASIRALVAETGRSYGWVHRLLTEVDTPLRGRGGNQRATRD